MSYSSTSAAAKSSCVDSGFDAQRTTSAPPAFSVRARVAVSVVTCMQGEVGEPESGCSLSKRSRMAASTGICRSAHSIRRMPSGASAMSFTSCRLVVAIQSFPLVLGDEQSLVLSLFPVEGREFGACEPGVDGSAEVRLAPQSRSECHVGELDLELLPEPPERAELVQLEQAVGAVSGGSPARDDETGALQVTEHSRRPARPGSRLADRGRIPHGSNLNTAMSGLRGS